MSSILIFIKAHLLQSLLAGIVIVGGATAGGVVIYQSLVPDVEAEQQGQEQVQGEETPAPEEQQEQAEANGQDQSTGTDMTNSTQVPSGTNNNDNTGSVAPPAPQPPASVVVSLSCSKVLPAQVDFGGIECYASSQDPDAYLGDAWIVSMFDSSGNKLGSKNASREALWSGWPEGPGVYGFNFTFDYSVDLVRRIQFAPNGLINGKSFIFANNGVINF